MHGLETMAKLNEIAYQKRPHDAAVKASEQAARVNRDVEDKLAKRKVQRETLIKELARMDTFELLKFVEDSNCPTVLEKALASKLAFLAANMEAGYVGNRQIPNG